jgi:hypothetical protein
MGLDQFTTQTPDEPDTISTRKKLKNVNLDREYYVSILEDDPREFLDLVEYVDESSTKAVAQLIDETLQNEDSDVELDEAKPKISKRFETRL